MSSIVDVRFLSGAIMRSQDYFSVNLTIHQSKLVFFFSFSRD